MSFFRILILFTFMVMISCSSVRHDGIYQDFEDDQVEVGMVSDDLLTMEVAYIGAIGHSYIFECIITNHSADNILVDPSHFKLAVADDFALRPINTEEVIVSLQKDRKSLAKRRKTETALGFLGVGLNVLLGASTGLSVGEAVLTSAEPLIYIADDRRWYDRNIESVEDEIKYVNSTYADVERIQGGEFLAKDVLFPTKKIDSDVDFVFAYGEQEYIVTFPRDIFQ